MKYSEDDACLIHQKLVARVEQHLNRRRYKLVKKHGPSKFELASICFIRVMSALARNAKSINDNYLDKTVRSVLVDQRRRLIREKKYTVFLEDNLELKEGLAANANTVQDAVLNEYLQQEPTRDVVMGSIRLLVGNFRFKILLPSEHAKALSLITLLRRMLPLPFGRKELAEFLGVSLRTIDCWENRGMILRMSGSGRRVTFSLPDVLATLLKFFAHKIRNGR